MTELQIVAADAGQLSRQVSGRDTAGRHPGVVATSAARTLRATAVAPPRSCRGLLEGPAAVRLAQKPRAGAGGLMCGFSAVFQAFAGTALTFPSNFGAQGR